MSEDIVSDILRRRISRRSALSTSGKVALGVIIAGIVGAAGGYYAGAGTAREITKKVTERITETITKTVGSAPSVITEAVTKTVTVTAGATPTGFQPIPPEELDPYTDYLIPPPGSAALPGGPLGDTPLPAFTRLDEYRKEPPYKIVLASHGGGISWTELMKKAYTLRAKMYEDLGLIEEFIYREPFFDVEKQVSQLEEIYAMEPDAVVISPTNPEAIIPHVDKFFDAGIPTVIVNSEYVGKKFSAFRMQDNRLFGKLQALWLVKQLKGKGKIIVLRGAPGEGPDIYRWELGAKPIIDAYPDMEVLGVAPTGWSYDGGKKATEAFLAAHPQIDGVISIGGEPTAGAVDAFIEAGRELVPMTGEDSNALVKRWLKYRGKTEYGYFDSVFPVMPVWWGAMGIDAAIALLQGIPVKRTILFAPPFIPNEKIPYYVEKYHFDKFPDDFWWNAFWYIPYDELAKMFGMK